MTINHHRLDGMRTERQIWSGFVAVVALAAAIFALSRLDYFTGLAGRAGHHGAHVHEQTATSNSGEAARPRTTLKRLSCDPLPNAAGKSITSALVDFPPRAFTPQHRHPGSVLSFITKGSIRSQLGGESPRTFSTGETLFEPPGTVHMFAENPSSTEPAQLLSIFVADDDCGPLIVFD